MAASRARRRLTAPRLFVLVAASTLAGCGGLEASGTPAHRLSVWVSGSGMGGTIGTVEADDSRIATVIEEHRGSAAVHTDCALLVTDLSNGAAGDLPSPDTEVTQDLSRAFNDEARAGSTCADHPGDAAVLAQARSAWTTAEVLFQAALDRVAAVTGHAPATTVTTQAGSNGGMF